MSRSTDLSMRVCVITNPNSGTSGNIDALKERLVQGDCELCETTHAGHAGELARQAVARRFDRVIAAGGDGTINEILNGIAPDFGAIELAIVPLGTGNDLARALDVPDDAAEALELALTGTARPIDVGRFEGCNRRERYFANVSAGGFGGIVNEYVKDKNKERWGSLAYIASAFAAMREAVAYDLRISLDGREFEVKSYNIVIANGRTAAGGIPVAPEAMLDDGLLEVIVLPAGTLGQSALAALQIILGRQNESDKVITLRAKNIAVHCEPDMPFNVDGELQGECDATFEVMPRALRIVAGPKAALGNSSA